MVYWPIPKVACTTLKTYFAQLQGIKFKGLVHGAPFEYTDAPIDGFFNFAYVRNPYDRLNSLYNEKIVKHKAHEKHLFKNAVYEGMSFYDFVQFVISDKNPDPHYNTQISQIPVNGVELIKIETDPLIRILPHQNVSMKVDNYDEQTKSMVRDHYYKDFLYLGYWKRALSL